jgi:ADP-heptose:LPS heptosyltransferase
MAVDVNGLVRRVLIYRLGSLGDTIVSLPSLHLVKRAFPRAERRLLTNFPVARKAAAAQTILEGSGLIDGYLRYTVGLRHLNKLLQLRREIRAWKPDVLVYLMPERGWQTARRDAVFFKLCGIERIIGLPLARELRESQYQTATGLMEPEASRLARCLAELGDVDVRDAANWDLHLSDSEHMVARTMLEAMDGRSFISFSLGTKMPTNDWGNANWSELLRQMARMYPGYGLVAVGAASEFDRCLQVMSGWKSEPCAGPTLNLCGQLQPRESAAVVAGAKLFVGHDSGPMHMASAVQTPLVAVFSARNLPGVWFPLSKQSSAIYHKVECAGCRLEKCEDEKMKCITSVTVNEVLAEVRKILPPKVVTISA